MAVTELQITLLMRNYKWRICKLLTTNQRIKLADKLVSDIGRWTDVLSKEVSAEQLAEYKKQMKSELLFEIALNSSRIELDVILLEEVGCIIDDYFDLFVIKKQRKQANK